MTEPKFKAGDKVLVDGTVVAVLDRYDVENNIVTWTTAVGGATNTTTNALSHTRIESVSDALQRALDEHAGLANEYKHYPSEFVTEEPVADKETPNADFDSLQ